MDFLREFKNRRQLFILVGACMLMIAVIQMIFLFWFYRITRNNMEANLSNVLTQLEANMTQSAETIIRGAEGLVYDNLTQHFMASDNYQFRAEYTRYVKGLMNTVAAANANIRDIYLRDQQGRFINYSSSATLNYIDIFDDMYNTFLIPADERGRGYFYSLPLEGIRQYVYILPFYLFGNPNAACICYIIYGNNSFTSMMNSIELPEDTSLFLVNRSGDILASNREEHTGMIIDGELSGIINRKESNSAVKYRGVDSLIKQHAITDMGWTLVSLIPMEGILRPINNMVTIGYILELLLLSGLWFLIRRNLDSWAEIYRAELAKKEAEFQALQSRINPHFLYNTLDCIRVIAYMRNVPEIVTISSSMAKMFRYSIKNESTASIADELGCITDYLEILKVRYNNRFHIEKHIDTGILSARIIKFVLQPLVENAFFHGLERKGDGTLRITGSLKDGGDIVFEIFDTGKGIEKERLEQLNSELRENFSGETVFALANINRRLKIAYGPKYGLRIESEYGNWCKVHLRIGSLPESAGAKSEPLPYVSVPVSQLKKRRTQ